MDLGSLVNRATPQDLLSVNYTGILNPNLFVEAQYALRKYTFQGSGSLFTDPIQGTMLLDQSRGNARYWSPTFCGVCDDETRDNNNFVAKVSYFLSTSSAGSHSFVFGADVFDDKRFANNHQSGSDYRIYGTSAILQGESVFPVFDSRTYIQWNPILEGSQGNRFRTLSFFANDSWTLGKRWRFNLGLRYDKNDGKDSVGTVVVKDSAWSPRLSATFDPRGDGQWTASASYAKYVASIASGVGDTSAGGNPATIQYEYLGPAVNVGNPASPVGAADALTTLFNWFNANGGTNRPTRGAPNIPGLTARIGEGLASPNVQELTLGVTRRLGSRGLVRLDGIYRQYRDFYAFDVNTGNGTVSDPFGKVYDLGYTVNTNDVERKYKGLNFQVSYRAHDRLNLGGNYTLSNAYGNFNGETGPNGPVTSSILTNREYFDGAWSGGPVDDRAPRRLRRRADRRPAPRRAPPRPRLGHLGRARSRRRGSGERQLAAGLQHRLAVRRRGLRRHPSVRDEPRLREPAVHRRLLLHRPRRVPDGLAPPERRLLELREAPRHPEVGGLLPGHDHQRVQPGRADELRRRCPPRLGPDGLRHGRLHQHDRPDERELVLARPVQPLHGHPGRGRELEEGRDVRAGHEPLRLPDAPDLPVLGGPEVLSSRSRRRPGSRPRGSGPGAVFSRGLRAKRAAPARSPTASSVTTATRRACGLGLEATIASSVARPSSRRPCAKSRAARWAWATRWVGNAAISRR